MKYYINKYKTQVVVVFLAAVTILPTSCKKGYFDQAPKDIQTIDMVFSTKLEAENWLSGVYNRLPDVWADGSVTGRGLAELSDELEETTPSIIASGTINGQNSINVYTSYYQAIRLANIFMANINNPQSNILNEPNGQDLIKQYTGEARFLRAYYYWMLIKLYGPVVLVGDKIAGTDDDFQLPRNSWSECINYIVSEMNAAKDLVPEKHLNPSTGTEDLTQTGRIDKLIVESVLSQVLLYDASPLFNGNPYYANFKNPDGKVLMNLTYDATKWGKAATAAKVAIDHAIANGKKLYKETNADPFTAAVNSCRNLFLTGWADEGIWLRTVTGYAAWELDAAPRAANGTATNAVLSLPQEMIDKYRMINGKQIEETGSTYVESGFTATAKTGYYVAGTSNMYVNREPRFYANVTFNGSNIPFVPRTGLTKVEFWPAGNSGNGNGSQSMYPKTGYLVRKNTNVNRNLSTNAGNIVRPAMYIRLGELYLNYAEALNESAPGSVDILTYLNAIRVRAGIPALTGSFDQATMRSLIQRERCIELAYEGHRFFDLRRWKIATTPEGRQGGDFFGMNVFTGTGLSDPAFYVRTRTSTRVWNDRYYLLPLPQSEVQKNRNMVQTFGY
ncbi:RagB/SusD family nutrient uptake outer membrane protein [Mucilaginibacter boryungensis]|uniref:RagB/SusD family nutrient uptake outer membrane protein n=1 Tax=Mucilaginibacter boryungensis TaxID=768480 RepID=A0ABR9XFD9_9SPHI|nr:RagB/SusD family nutrient uptake outer membrane protein [Mucilaginibacter boryungensis]MBE9666102.1 RagB/SusD family nutrient uptake outer membrane protein [Mucilaginibacter boryungensis]